ncbi:SMC-Scp complex subunit ScpB [Candidatus Uhrbacteria bacterium]|nr:SMC-Scp complex subunit ScpB [Candidatus Uhrbacteria bacterium]
MIQPSSARVEALLFVAQKPLTVKKISQLTELSEEDVRGAVDELSRAYAGDAHGIVLLRHVDSYELATHPLHTETIAKYTKEEITGELTRAGLETLTVIAYRGPMTKIELESVRGVNCTIVLRNLMMRGLVDASGSDKGEKKYSVSFDFLRHLQVSRIEDIPDYEQLHHDARLEALMSTAESGTDTGEKV